MSVSFFSAPTFGGWPNVGSGLEINGAFTQAGAAGLLAYAGIVGAAPRTILRSMEVIPSASGITQFFLIRAIGGQAVIPNIFVPLNTNIGTPQAQAIGGNDKTVLTGIQHLLFTLPINNAGQNSLSVSTFLGPYVVLFPGDACVCISSTVLISLGITMNWVELLTSG